MKLFTIIAASILSFCVPANAARIFTLDFTETGNDLILTLRENISIRLTQPTQFGFVGFRLTDIFASTGGNTVLPTGDFSNPANDLFGISTPAASEAYSAFGEGSSFSSADNLDLIGLFQISDSSNNADNLTTGDVVTLLAGSVILEGGADGINTDIDFDPELGIPSDAFAELTLVTFNNSGQLVDVSNPLSVNVIPEPSAALLGLVGSFFVIARRKR